ncbi:Radical SAM superfamily enzyme, MoaA/NifB/PqqE/SkfB family [Methylobacterium sp. ap11]|uniref:STM4011 family radical SAM protein n=1 Tax=Methylobacterium sp. ap11 TaxID=1761799 RepID=UPI0008C515CA|nr:STM4011 family radical SAM protein [Methylobacterium sp. ap11]SEO56137.1 Radical SAM superfamily enzyme, MoaA/NifB/PqqE/SkfB family [Methylobacterium sp. ap11]
MTPHLDILYRGPLSSCNYACPYCPFAKRRDSRETLARDARQLARFVAWAEGQTQRSLGILFTPWGEALIRPAYRDAMARLSRLAHIRKVAAQTNLSWPTAWLDACDPARIAFWCTFHPGETPLDRFLDRCAALDARGIRYSVGIVGKREHMPALAELRRHLRPEVYLWVNAYRDEGAGYDAPDDLALIRSIDPLFDVNRAGIRSRGLACATGETVISVDGDGEIRRCHTVKARIGNLYDPGFDAALTPRPCPLAQCRCHIGYAHMPHLGFREAFGAGLLERALPLPVAPLAGPAGA